ncbi:Fe2+-dependent dioxygenase, partial [Bordetella hinzii]|nr:Fe2+-dependent dioxygenase [Bordetella hinzii]
MLLHIPAVLEPAVARQYLLDLENTAWEDGARTAGFQSALVKHNRQLPADSAVGRRIAAHIEQQLLRHPLFISAALPARIFPMLFNRYSAGDAFGMHVDNAIRYPPGETRGLRTDLSATLFLCEPAQYDGGELVIRDTYGEHSVKLPAGHMVLYPATSLHRVTEVTR